MIINGGPRRNWRFFAKHLVRTDENERVTVAEIRGLAGDTPLEALREMDALASGTRCKDFFYHANLNPRDDERLTPQQWELAVDRLEANLGLEGQSRLVVEHEKEGRVHRHVIWSRIDPDSLTAISDSHNFAKHAATSRELEKEFDLQPVRPVLVEPEGPRPERRPKNWETFRGHKSGIDPHDVKAEVTALWQEADSGRAFRTALAERGYVLAQGDRRDFCLIDPAGQEHSLARRIDGAKAAEIRARLADIDRDDLPKVGEGRAERREDKQRVEEAVNCGAQKTAVERVINAGHAARSVLSDKAGDEETGGRETVRRRLAYDEMPAPTRERAPLQPEATAWRQCETARRERERGQETER
jgi:hypothetical protein